MAANMMETLKQIQRDLADQKAYMRNLHLINKNLNDKLNFMEEKISDLPQVLSTIGRLEQQVKKNNMLLFGNDETGKNFEDRALVPYKKDHDDKNTDHQVYPPGKCIENTEATPLYNPSKVSLIDEAEKNSGETINADSFQRTDQYEDEDRVLIINEIKEVKEILRDFMKIRYTSVEESAKCCIHDAASLTYLNTDQIIKLDDKLNDISNVYQSDMREMKELIKDLAKKMTVEGTASKVREQKTIQISPTYFSADQLSKLNSELKRIAETYQDTNIFPIVEVMGERGANDEHPVMKQLRDGVYYLDRHNPANDNCYKVKLGHCGLRRSDVSDIIANNPNLSLNDVVVKWMSDSGWEWDRYRQLFNFSTPFILDENGKLVVYDESKISVS